MLLRLIIPSGWLSSSSFGGGWVGASKPGARGVAAGLHEVEEDVVALAVGNDDFDA